MWSLSQKKKQLSGNYNHEKDIAFAAGLLVGAGYTVEKISENQEPKKSLQRAAYHVIIDSQCHNFRINFSAYGTYLFTAIVDNTGSILNMYKNPNENDETKKFDVQFNKKYQPGGTTMIEFSIAYLHSDASSVPYPDMSVAILRNSVDMTVGLSSIALPTQPYWYSYGWISLDNSGRTAKFTNNCSTSTYVLTNGGEARSDRVLSYKNLSGVI